MVISLYPSNFFRKPSFPVDCSEVVVVLGFDAQENRESFVESYGIFGGKVAHVIRKYSVNKRFEIHLVPDGEVCFEYHI